MTDAAPPARHLRVAEAVCWFGYGAIGLSGGLLGPTLPALRLHLHAGYAGLAFLFMAGNVGSALATLFGNRLLDVFGFKRLLAACGAGLGIACLSRAGVGSLAAWVALGAVAGFAASGIDIGGIRFVTLAAPATRRNAALNLLNVFYSAGAVAAPLLVSALATTGASVLWAYTIAGVALLATAATAAATVPGDRPVTVEADILKAWCWSMRQPVLVRLALVLGLYAGVETGFVGWVASYAQSRDHLAVAVAALFPLVFWAAMTAGRSLAAERARRWSEGTLLTLGALTTIAGGALALAARDPFAIAAGAALSGLGCAPIWPSLFALAAHAAPAHHSEAYGLLFPASSAGGLIAPWLAGELFTAAGPQAALAVPLAFAVLMSALLAYVLARDVAAAKRLVTQAP